MGKSSKKGEDGGGGGGGGEGRGFKMVETGARSVANKPLPAPTTTEGVTQVLFYQYVEPVWSARRQKQALAEFHRLAALHDVTGRGQGGGVHRITRTSRPSPPPPPPPLA